MTTRLISRFLRPNQTRHAVRIDNGTRNFSHGHETAPLTIWSLWIDNSVCVFSPGMAAAEFADKRSCAGGH